LGYRHVLAWIEGRIEQRKAVEEMQKHTRRYAKRQWTWFRAMTGAHWIDVTGRDATGVAAEIARTIESNPPSTGTWALPDAEETDPRREGGP
jgi:tRNA dimethylallyltransferase